MKTEPRAYDAWQIRMIQSILHRKDAETLLSAEHLNSLLQLGESHMEITLDKCKQQLREFISASNVDHFKPLQTQMFKLMQIASIIVFYQIPSNVFDASNDQSQTNYLRLLATLKKAKLQTNTVQIISRLLDP